MYKLLYANSFLIVCYWYSDCSWSSNTVVQDQTIHLGSDRLIKIQCQLLLTYCEKVHVMIVQRRGGGGGGPTGNEGMNWSDPPLLHRVIRYPLGLYS